jgi:hypothetical protein
MKELHFLQIHKIYNKTPEYKRQEDIHKISEIHYHQEEVNEQNEEIEHNIVNINEKVERQSIQKYLENK